ncbi:MAG TPA: cyclic pyranopterin monophosphate synthase MoaC [Chloroflexota bacterium]|jgi:cyclic pyranopterin phosphate synthase|nr:cyclic pyranopterin monophosphate synthase MoaC [Chloroflexota bacterium]
MAQLSHIDEQGRARMVDVSAKDDTLREAIATGEITMRRETLELIVSQREAGAGMAPSGADELAKGDVLGTAQIAGIMAAKRTWELIPMCHQLLITGVAVDFGVDFDSGRIEITGTARTRGKTGVEMEALTAVSVAALTIYDMVKAVDQTMEIGKIHLARKTGGKSDLGIGHA